MLALQNDLLEIYNNLVIFSKTTVQSSNPIPITVRVEDGQYGSPIVFEQGGISVRLRLPIYYCLGFDTLTKPTYLLPRDYDFMMSSLQSLIANDKILEDRICLSPENYGFDVYSVDYKDFWKGPNIIGSVRFISGNSWLFRTYVKWKYKLK